MQRGSLAMVSRKEGPAVWQFRWSEKDLHGIRVQRKRVIGTVERYPDESAARSAVTVLLQEINSDKVRTSLTSFLLADYKPIERFGLFLAGIAGEKWSRWVLALPF